ncbi:uncharacterized protein ColSpa_09969 [Colletotrichum spaethianum]|uniref:Uncharacterized protein n=1 Tax=Colletotrichum spaethianum TaxID=700344 RepID=A0AA37USE5_9PEZI|nr:uncharacterized protein ColSpa_09969 [Colletotrichum spaethianum]GKT49788.1 hypothetical protein ColSpa_09969 [Colletotrichum spaethianum]
MAFASADPIFEDSDDQRAFRVCKMETACRFDKDHFDNGASCQGTHCEDPKQKEHFEDIPTNTRPELHNISAAMRRAVSQGYLFPYRGYWPSEPEIYDPILVAQGMEYVVPVSYRNNERPQGDGSPDLFQPSYESCVHRHLAQPNLQVLKTIANPAFPQNTHVTVIPFLKPSLDDASRFDRIWKGVFFSAVMAMGGPDAWEAWWLSSGQADETDQDPDAVDAESERYLRNDISLIATRLLADDSGLSDARAWAVAEILLHVWQVSPIERGKHVGPALLGLVEKLLETVRKAMKDRLYSFAGEMLATDDALRYTQYYFKRNRELWLHDEHTRQQAIENTVEPLTKPEIDALCAADPDARDCVACGEEMAYPPDAHAAMRLKCGAGHTIGMKCWTKALRRKKGVFMDGIKCHSCADKILGPWKMPVNLRVVDAYDVATMPPLHLRVPDVIEL